MHDIYLELDAWRPRWRLIYKTMQQAVSAMLAESPSMRPYLTGLWQDWLMTEEAQHLQRVLPPTDYTAKPAEPSDSLPFNYSNIGQAFLAMRGDDDAE